MSNEDGETTVEASSTVGPPLSIVAVGILSLVVSLGLAVIGGVPMHVVGYVTGAIVPVLVFGIARRADLDRRRDPAYETRSVFRNAMLVLGVGAILTAALHIWPLATEFAS